jgi:rhodanese-related sulfurtransferase
MHMTNRCGLPGLGASVVALTLLPLMLGQGCPRVTDSPEEEQAAAVQAIPPTDAYAMIQGRAADPTFMIIDVRTPQEFAAGHIEGAVNVCVLLCTPSFDEAIAGYDKSLTYLVYCGTHHRSPAATGIMLDQGFEHVYDMTGGLNEWQAEGLPVIQ